MSEREAVPHGVTVESPTAGDVSLRSSVLQDRFLKRPRNRVRAIGALTVGVLALGITLSGCTGGDSKTGTPENTPTAITRFTPTYTETTTLTPTAIATEGPVATKTPEVDSRLDEVIQRCTPSLKAEKLSAEELKSAKVNLKNYTQFLSRSGHRVVEDLPRIIDIGNNEQFMHFCVKAREGAAEVEGINLLVDGKTESDYHRLVETIKDSDGKVNVDGARGLPFARGMTDKGDLADGNRFQDAQEVDVVAETDDFVDVAYHLKDQKQCDSVVVRISRSDGSILELGPMSGHLVNGQCALEPTPTPGGSLIQ